MTTRDSAPIHQTLDQERAKMAWRLVNDAKQTMNNKFDKYESLVKRFPALVNRNGFGQSIAFLFSKAKGGNAEELLLGHLSQWLMQSEINDGLHCYTPPYSINYPSGNLISSITDNDSHLYLLATREALLFLDYLRRFADGINQS